MNKNKTKLNICDQQITDYIKKQDLFNLKSFKSKIQYCKQHFKYMKMGSSRMVFQASPTRVIKLAFNKKGVLQNQVQCGDWYKNSFSCFPEVYSLTQDYMFAQVQRCFQCKLSDFPRIFGGHSFQQICEVIRYECHRRNNRAFYYENFSKQTQQFNDLIWDQNNQQYSSLNSFFNFLGDYGGSQSLVTDLFSIRNWGIVKRDYGQDLVILDSGYNDQTEKLYHPTH